MYCYAHRTAKVSQELGRREDGGVTIFRENHRRNLHSWNGHMRACVHSSSHVVPLAEQGFVGWPLGYTKTALMNSSRALCSGLYLVGRALAEMSQDFSKLRD